MRIGIGCTTYNRPDCLAKWKEQVAKHTFMDNVLIYIAEDTDNDRRGVAYRKNECLRALQDCDHVFLFDDDCWPIKDGWVNFFVEATETGNNHFLFLNKSHINKISVNYFEKTIATVGGKSFTAEGNTAFICINQYSNCGGVFMSLTKDCIDKVGAFNEKFNLWGFEHAEYSQRIFKSGLNDAPYLCLHNTDKYLHSKDYSEPSHKSSISDEEKQKYFNENFPKFKEPIKNIYIPL